MNVQPTNDRVDPLFERYTRPGVPGCALAVLQDGQVVYKQGYGLADLERNVPVLPSTVFNIGSMAKQFTAFAIALLEDEGKLSLDDGIRTYLPGMHDYGQTLTIRHLIHHTSGLRGSFPELLALAEWRDTDATTTDDVYRLLKAQRELNYRPGDEYLYVNSNYVLLALICERVSGQSFAVFCRERIFDPLDMTRTVINNSFYGLIPGRALGYYDDDQGQWFNAPLTDSVVGPTNVYTTVEDMAKWDENFCTGMVGGPAVLERVLQPGRLNDGTELDYAFGLEVGPKHRHRGWQIVEHGGGQGGYGSWMLRFPELHLSVVVMFNRFLWGMRDYAIKVADLFLHDHPDLPASAGEPVPAQEAPAAVVLAPEQLEEKAGTYLDRRRASLRTVSCAAGRISYLGMDLVPRSANLFSFETMPDTYLEFVPDESGGIKGMKVLTPSSERVYERMDSVTPTREELAQYAGRYYSPELDLYWTFGVEDDHLVCRRRKYVDSRLAPLFADAFSDDWQPLMGYPATYLVVFERDSRQAVTGFRVSGSRVRHLGFVRQDHPGQA